MASNLSIIHMSAIALKTITETPSTLDVPHRHRPAPKHLPDVRCQMEPWSPEALAPSFWFETIDFPRVFLWSLSSAFFLMYPRESIDSWRSPCRFWSWYHYCVCDHSKQEAICATSITEARLLVLFVIENPIPTMEN